MRAQREVLGISQQELADRLGVQRNTIGSWERGIHYPSGEFMANALDWGFDLYYLVTGSRSIEAIRELSAREAALLDNYRNASQDGKALAHSVLDVVQKPGTRTKKSVG